MYYLMSTLSLFGLISGTIVHLILQLNQFFHIIRPFSYNLPTMQLWSHNGPGHGLHEIVTPPAHRGVSQLPRSSPILFTDLSKPLGYDCLLR